MKKTLFTLTLALVGLSTAFAQVGIGTTTPQATLDVKPGATETTYATGDGILIPRVSAVPTAAAGDEGELVYVNGDGFYYNTGGTTWVPFAEGGAIDNADLTTGTGGIYKGSGSLSVGPTIVSQGANRLEFTGNGINGGIIAQFTNTGNNGRVLNLVRSGGIPNPGVGSGSSFIRFEQSGLNLGSFIPNADVANSTGITFLSTQVNAFSVGSNGNAFSVDAANNRVGIKNKAPNADLTVGDNFNAFGSIRFNGAAPTEGVLASFNGGVEIFAGPTPIRPGTAALYLAEDVNYLGNYGIIQMETADNYFRIGMFGNNENMIRFTTTAILPENDAVINLGSGTNRFNTLFASNGTINTSDARLKSNVKELRYGLETVLKMHPVDYLKFSNFEKTGEATQEIGFLAQELQALVPEAVSGDANSDVPMGVRYTELIPVLTKAIQEQQAQIEALKAEIEELKK